MTLDDYINSHIDTEPEQLAQLYRHTHLYRLYPRMCTDHYQGRLLTMLTAMAAPMRILELGAFTGYSTLCLAEGMPAGAQVHTVEIDDEMADDLRDTFDASPRGADIHLHIGDALQVVPALDIQQWDMVLIDANKRNYIDYYEMLLPRVRRGGIILADNTLWGDKVTLDADAKAARDPQTRAILEFNDHVVADERVSVVILPIRDGLSIIRKR